MTVIILTKPDEVSPYLATVQAEVDNHKKNFGFVRPSIYANLRDKGTLWILLDNGKYAGHLMFSAAFTKSQITVEQTYVLSAHKRKGYGKRLIDELKRWGEKHNIMHLKAKVASDLNVANKFYNNMGFRAIQQIDGGITTGRKLNVRLLTLDTPSLLGIIEKYENAPPFVTATPVNTEHKYVLDMNVIIDFIQQRDGKEYTETILKHAMQGDIRVYITAEAKTEALRALPSVPKEQLPLLHFIKLLPELPIIPDKDVKKLSSEIEKIIFGTINKDASSAPNKSSDVKHIIHSIQNGVTGFITRDNEILKSAVAIYENYRLEVFSPDEFLLTEVETPNNNITLNADGLKFSIESVSETDAKKINPLLKKLGVAHNEITMTQYNGLLVTVNENNPVLAIWSKPHKKNEGMSAYILYADGFNNTYVFDHILESIFRAARNEGAPLLAVYTKNTDEIIANTLKKRGFSFDNFGNFIKHTRFMSDKIISPKEWDSFCEIFKKHTKRELSGTLQSYDKLDTNGIMIGSQSEYINFFNLETMLYPTLIVPKGRKVAIIPIIPAFSDELIESEKIQLQLKFEKQPAFLKIEKAYFKKPGYGYKIGKGDLILFYASGKIGAIIGAARATLSGDYTIEEIRFQFKQQGVLADHQLKERSKKGKVHTITFDNFIPFCQNVSLVELRKLGLGTSNFQNTTETTSDMFLKVCALGGIYGE